MVNEDLKRKIAALRQKTTENGATEAEAMEAMAVVEKLMAKHQITQEELSSWETNSSKVELSETESVSKGKFMEPAYQWLSKSIMEFCGTFHVHYTSSFKVKIYGREEDVKVAEYMFFVLNTAIHQGFAQWQRDNPPNCRVGTRQQQYNAFCSGFAEAVRAKLNELRPESDSTALVVKKSELVKKRYTEVHGDLRKIKASTVRTADSTARQAGRTAGSRVNLNRPVGTSAGARGRLK